METENNSSRVILSPLPKIGGGANTLSLRNTRSLSLLLSDDLMSSRRTKRRLSNLMLLSLHSEDAPLSDVNAIDCLSDNLPYWHRSEDLSNDDIADFLSD